MRTIFLFSLALLLFFFGCHHNTKTQTQYTISAKSGDTKALRSEEQDLAEIHNLIRSALKWADTCKTIHLLPATFGKDSICTGFNSNVLNHNLETLRNTGFFADEFVDNYSHIIRTLEEKIKKHQFDPWHFGELPTFSFANDASPWCLCQDNLSWDDVDIAVVKLTENKAELKWNWGRAATNADTSWQNFSYKFKRAKVDGTWKIAYLQGFDYIESTK